MQLKADVPQGQTTADGLAPHTLSCACRVVVRVQIPGDRLQLPDAVRVVVHEALQVCCLTCDGGRARV